MGQNIREATHRAPWWYYLWFPIVVLFRTAQNTFSLVKFLCNFLNGNKFEEEIVIQYEWKFYFFGMCFCWELLSWFKFLLWLSGYYVITSLELVIGGGYASFLAFYGNEFFNCSTERRMSERKFLRHPYNCLPVFDERLMVLSHLRIFVDLALFFCKPLLDTYLFFSSWKFAKWKLFSSLLTAWGDWQPPWPPPYVISKLIGYGAITTAYTIIFGYLTVQAISKSCKTQLASRLEEKFYSVKNFMS